MTSARAFGFYVVLCVMTVCGTGWDAQAIEADALKILKPFTSQDGPATVETCTPSALGQHPHPAHLAACLYLPFVGDAEVWDFKDKSNRLLSVYATVEFNDLLEKNYKKARESGEGIVTFGIFFSDEENFNFQILGSTFDAEKGIATVLTADGDKPFSYTLVFVVEDGLWRVDDIHLFHKGCNTPEHIKTVIANVRRWYHYLWNCGKR